MGKTPYTGWHEHQHEAQSRLDGLRRPLLIFALYLVLWHGLSICCPEWLPPAFTTVLLHRTMPEAQASSASSSRATTSNRNHDHHPDTEMGWPPPANGQHGYATLETGLGMTGSSPVLTTRLGLVAELQKAGITMGLGLPFRVNIWEDNSPAFTLRTEDWNERSDYLGLLRFLDYQTPSDPIYATVGELSSISIGHGTITGQYYNQLQRDHRQTGIALNAAFIQGGIQAMVDDLADPSMAGGRFTIRPLAILGLTTSTPAPIREMTVGMTAAGDAFTDDRAHQAGLQGGVFIFGFDVDLPVRITRFPLAITPYADFNRIWGLGSGLHIGTMVEAVFARAYLDTSLKVEWQHMTGTYQPQYFGPMYELERLGFQGPTAQTHGTGSSSSSGSGSGSGVDPKSTMLLHPDTMVDDQGLHVEAAISIASSVSLSTMITHAFARNQSALAVRAQLINLGAMRLGACYLRQGLAGTRLGDPVFLENSTMLMGEARLQVTPALYFHFQGGRHWEFEGERLSNAGWDWTGGGGLRIWF